MLLTFSQVMPRSADQRLIERMFGAQILINSIDLTDFRRTFFFT